MFYMFGEYAYLRYNCGERQAMNWTLLPCVLVCALIHGDRHFTKMTKRPLNCEAPYCDPSSP